MGVVYAACVRHRHDTIILCGQTRQVFEKVASHHEIGIIGDGVCEIRKLTVMTVRSDTRLASGQAV